MEDYMVVVIPAYEPDEKLLGVSGIARILIAVLDERHTFIKLLLCNADCLTEIECIKVLNLSHDDHDVVGRLVKHQQFAIAVIDDAPCREYDIVEKSVIISTAFIFLIR